MKEKRNLFLVTALCGMAAFTAGCSSNWIAGDPPDTFYIEDPIPVPESKPETPLAPVVQPVDKPEAKPEAKPVIPAGENIPTTPDIAYTVQKGETLADLSRVFGVSAKDIANRNGLAVSAKLTPGQTIFIPADKVALKDAKKVADVKTVPPQKKPEPVKEPAKEPVKEPAKEPVKEPAKEPVKEPAKEPAKEAAAPASGTVIHIVKKGDMLSKLAVKYKVSYFEIAKANNIAVDSTLKIGQKLVIPLDKAKKSGKTQPAKTSAAPAQKQTQAAPAQKQTQAAPAKKESSAAAGEDDIFGTEFGPSADAPAPAAKPAAKTTAKPAAKPAAKTAADDLAWATMVLKTNRKITVEKFAQINRRSLASILVLNPQFTADTELSEGTEVKVFIDPARQQ